MIDRVTSGGKHLVVDIVEQYGQTWSRVTVDDKHLGGCMVCIERNGKYPAPAVAALCLATGKIGLLAGEAEIIEAEQARLMAEYRTSPAGLRSQREALLRKLSSRDEDAIARSAKAWDQEDEMGSVSIISKHETARAALVAEIDEFDAAHPEIIASLRAEKIESANRAD